MKTIIQEFKAFALSGNVLDLAIGVIVGAAFGEVVKSFANDVLMQLIAAIFGKPDFSALSFHIGKGKILYGNFLTTTINFLLVAGSLLLVVKLLMRVGLNFRAQGNRECDECKNFVPVDASRCMYCTSTLVPLAD